MKHELEWLPPLWASSPRWQMSSRGRGACKPGKTNHSVREEYDKCEIALFEKKTFLVGGVLRSWDTDEISIQTLWPLILLNEK